jgi:hypothetical protein
MSIKGRRLAMTAVGAAAGLLVGSTAQAAPANGPVFTVTCPGMGTFDVVTAPGQGAFTPAFVVGSRQVFVVYSVSGTVTVSGDVVEEFDDVKAAPVPAGALTCTFEGNFGEATVAGTVVVVERGA